MSRAVKGYVEWRGDCWQVLATRPPGSKPRRKWYRLPGSIPRHDREQAERVGTLLAKRVRRGEALPEEHGETITEYLPRWSAWRIEKGFLTQDNTDCLIRKHFLPRYGPIPMAGFSSEMAEEFSDDLDGLMDRGELHGSSARTIFSAVRQMIKAAWHCKRKSVRVEGMTCNPFVGVEPPKSGETLELQFLYPDELLKLLAHEAIPLGRRRLYALEVYCYSRAGEVAALDWDRGDIDLEHSVMHVKRSHDRRTKNKRSRRIQIEPNLQPLLEAMHAETGAGRVLRIPKEWVTQAAYYLREDLWAAGVRRPELHNHDVGSRWMRNHDLRATGATWMAVAKVPLLTIAARIGDTPEVTVRYIRIAEAVGAKFGEPFPTLPGCLLSGEVDSGVFLIHLAALLAAGRVRLGAPEEPLPKEPGRMIGWHSGNDGKVHLLPSPTYRAVGEAVRNAGGVLPSTPHRIWRQLIDRGLATPPSGAGCQARRKHAGTPWLVIELSPLALGAAGATSPAAGTESTALDLEFSPVSSAPSGTGTPSGGRRVRARLGSVRGWPIAPEPFAMPPRIAMPPDRSRT